MTLSLLIATMLATTQQTGGLSEDTTVRYLLRITTDNEFVCLKGNRFSQDFKVSGIPSLCSLHPIFHKIPHECGRAATSNRNIYCNFDVVYGESTLYGWCLWYSKPSDSNHTPHSAGSSHDAKNAQPKRAFLDSISLHSWRGEIVLRKASFNWAMLAN